MTTETTRTPLTDKEIARLLTLYAASVEWSGETWDACGGPDPDGRDEPWISAPNMEEPGNASIVALEVAPADLDLIVAMRAAFPSLLAEVRASRAASRASPEEGRAREELRAQRESMETVCGAAWQILDEIERSDEVNAFDDQPKIVRLRAALVAFRDKTVPPPEDTGRADVTLMEGCDCGCHTAASDDTQADACTCCERGGERA